MREWVLPQIDLARCNLCGACVQECPGRAVDMTEHGPVIARPADCNYCANCEAACLVGAIHCAFEIVWDDADAEQAHGVSTEGA